MKILQLATYDLEVLDHGGKIRSFHIREALRRRFDVETLSFDWSSEERLSGPTVLLDQSRWPELGLDGMTGDWGICRYLEVHASAYNAVREHIRQVRPTILLLEQPFLWPLVQRLMDENALPKNTPIIYSAHNIEIGMKTKIYHDLYPSEKATRLSSYVKDIEQNLIARANALIAVSNTDAERLQALNPNAPLRVYSNGHTPPRLGSDGETAKWTAAFSSHSLNWVFVGSWHPPNINGLLSLIQQFPPSTDAASFGLWILGSAGMGLQAMREFPALRRDCLHIIGPTTASEIDTAILLSSGVILPIWEGAGSNLKTAQALLSNKCILSSSFSFRGFEQYSGEPGVHLAEDPASLARLMGQIVPLKTYARSAHVHDLEWGSILASLPDFISRLFNDSQRSHAQQSHL